MTIKFIISSLRKLRLWAGVFAVLLVVSASLSVVPVLTAAALTEEELYFYAQNGILFYDASCARSVAQDGDVVVSGETMEEKIWSGLTSFMTDEQAAGAMGNMAHEGLLNPVLHEGSFQDSGIDIFTDTRYSYGIGLIQWSWARRTGMLDSVITSHPELKPYFTGHSYNKNYTRGEDFLNALKREEGETRAHSIANALVALELSYLQMEMNDSRGMGLSNLDWSEYFTITDVDEAASYFLRKIEQPNNVDSQEPIRQQSAHEYYEQFAGAQTDGNAMAIPSGCISRVGLTDGGFETIEEAEAVIIEAYKNDNLAGLSLLTPSTGDKHDNCVAFSTWFVDRLTSITLPEGKIGGDGRDIAINLYNGWVGRYPLLVASNTPSVYAVASWRVAGAFTRSGNHTGIVVGINEETDTILIAEAGWGNHAFTGVHSYRLSDAINNPNYVYVDISAYLNDNLTRR